MKLRKLLAGTLAASMVIAAMPMASFAATKEKVNKVPSIGDGYEFTDNHTPLAYFTLQEDGESEYRESKQSFRMTLENGEFYTGKIDESYYGTDSNYDSSAAYMNAFATVENSVYGLSGGKAVEFTTIDKNTIAVEWNTGTDNGTKSKLVFPLAIKASDPGDVKLVIDSMGSELDSTSVVIAVASSGDTVASIADTQDFSDNMDMDTITIDETSIGAVDKGNGKEIKLKLPSKFSWGKKESDMSKLVQFNGGFSSLATLKSVKIDTDDSRELTITYDLANTTTKRGYVTIKNLSITADSDAKYGDVDVKITGDDITSQTLTVGKYQDYDVTIEADGDPTEILAGRAATSTTGTGSSAVTTLTKDDEVFELQKLVIKEDITNSWLAKRKTKVEFPSWVKIVGYDITKADNFDGTSIKTGGVVTDNSGDVKLDDDRNYIEFTTDGITSGKKGEVNIKFYVSVEADHSGDITATVSGRSLTDEQDVVLGKAIAPITASVDVKDVKIGRQKEELGTITISESQEEAIDDGDLVVKLPKDFEWSEDPTVKVTEGDLDIDDIDTDDNILTISVKGGSREASTIKITDAKVDLDRSIPEGEFNIEIGGDAIVQNSEDATGLKDKSNAVFDTDYVVKTVVANVVTPNVDDLAKGAGTAQKATFTVGSADYTVGQDTATADAAPYIQDGRTMVPVKYVAFALGIDPQNIKWDQATKTATIFGAKTVSITIGKNQIVVDGNVIAMDTKAVVKDGRAYLPIAYAANALGVPYTWDNATKTVSFN